MNNPYIPAVCRHPHGGWTLGMPISKGSTLRTYAGSFPSPKAAGIALASWKRQHLPPKAVNRQASLDFSAPVHLLDAA